MNRKFSAMLIIAILALVPCASFAGEKIPVHGKPGPGQIKILVRGNFKNPGYFWLAAGTKLPEVIKLARLKFDEKGDFDSPPLIDVIRQRNGKKVKARFNSSPRGPLRPEAKAAGFVLKDGDVVMTNYYIF